jgi:hypothetical protein
MFKQSSILFKYRLEDEAINLRKQAKGMTRGIRREELLRKASQIDVSVDVNKWLNSPSLPSTGKRSRGTKKVGRYALN